MSKAPAQLAQRAKHPRQPQTPTLDRCLPEDWRADIRERGRNAAERLHDLLFWKSRERLSKGQEALGRQALRFDPDFGEWGELDRNLAWAERKGLLDDQLVGRLKSRQLGQAEAAWAELRVGRFLEERLGWEVARSRPAGRKNHVGDYWVVRPAEIFVEVKHKDLPWAPHHWLSREVLRDLIQDAAEMLPGGSRTLVVICGDFWGLGSVGPPESYAGLLYNAFIGEPKIAISWDRASGEGQSLPYFDRGSGLVQPDRWTRLSAAGYFESCPDHSWGNPATLRVWHNPDARFPLDPGCFDGYEQYEWDAHEGRPKAVGEGPHVTVPLIRRTLRDALGDRLASAVVFGSYARGEHKPYSDIDVLVVTRGDKPADTFAAEREMDGWFKGTRPPVQCHQFFEAELDRALENYHPLMLHALNDGRAVEDDGTWHRLRSKFLAMMLTVMRRCGDHFEVIDVQGSDRFRREAEAYLSRARKDARVAGIALQAGELADGIFHAQQAVEKLLKCLLALKGHTGTLRHEAITEFMNKFSGIVPEEGLAELGRLVPAVEAEAIRSRYHISDGEGIVFNPATDYTEEQAHDIVRRMQRVFEILLPVLRDGYGLE